MRVEQARPRRGQRSGVSIWTAIIVVVLLGIFVSAVADAASLVFGGNIRTIPIQRQPGALPWNRHERLTALFIGTSGSPSAASVADQLVVLSFDPSTRSIRTLAIPVNLWVSIPGYGQGRIGDAFADGRARLTLLTVQSILHTDIAYYVAASQDTLQQLADTLGGVSVRLTAPTTVAVTGRHGTTRLRLAAGLHHVGGTTLKALLAPTRSGPDPLQAEQQSLLSLEGAALLPQNFFRIPTIVNSSGGQFVTNFPYNQVPSLAEAVMQVRSVDIHPVELSSTDGAITNAYPAGGGDVLIPDWQITRQIGQLVIPDPALGRAPVTVLNGSGMTGEAQTLAAWLREATVRVRSFESAASFNYPRTEVVVRRHASGTALQTARAVATLLQAPVVTGTVASAEDSVVVIIGRNFQDLTQQ